MKFVLICGSLFTNLVLANTDQFNETDQCLQSNMFDQNGQQQCITEKLIPEVTSLEQEILLAPSYFEMMEMTVVDFPEAPKWGSYGEIKTGPVYKSSNPFNGYDYWRYVSYYNIQSVKEELTQFPRVYEECQDADGFVSYQETLTIEARVGAKLAIGEIGFSADFSQRKTVGVMRNLRGKENEEAIHTPYLISDMYKGEVLLQTYSKKKSQSQLFKVSNGALKIEKVNPIFRVIRTKQLDCE